jgi:hypothetical protein
MAHDDALTRFTAVLASVRSLDTLQQRLCEASRTMLGADGVVIVNDTVDDGPVTVCWTTMLSRRLARLQEVCAEGPMVDAMHTGEVAVADFRGPHGAPWPALSHELGELDFTGTLVAIPLRSELSLRGVLMVHRDGGRLVPDAADARFLGAAIGTAVLQNPAIGAQSHVFAEVLTDRDVVHRATDVLGLEADVRYEDALALLRALAFTRGESLGCVAQAVIDGRAGLGQDLPPEDD